MYIGTISKSVPSLRLTDDWVFEPMIFFEVAHYVDEGP